MYRRIGSGGPRTARLLTAGALTLGVAGGVLATAGTASAHGRHGETVYVSAAHATASHSGNSCTQAKYATIDTGLAQLTSGGTVHVCAGTYGTQVQIAASSVTLEGTGTSTVIDPTTVTSEVYTADTPSTSAGMVPIVDVEPGAVGVSVRDLTVTGAGLRAAVRGCAPDPVGVLFRAASGVASTLTVNTLALSRTSLRGCQAGLGILVSETGTFTAPSGSSNVLVTGDTVTNFQKNGITCDISGSSCAIVGDTVIGSGPTHTIAQNGIQVAYTAVATVSRDTVSDVDYTGRTSMSTYAAGILVYAAGGTLAPFGQHGQHGHRDHHGTQGTQGRQDTQDTQGQQDTQDAQGQWGQQGPQAGVTEISRDTVVTAQIAISVVASDALVSRTTTSSSMATAIGVELLPCTTFCPSLGRAPQDTVVAVVGSSVTASGAGATGVWVGYTTRNQSTAPSGTLSKVTSQTRAYLFGDTITAATPTVTGAGAQLTTFPSHAIPGWAKHKGFGGSAHGSSHAGVRSARR